MKTSSEYRQDALLTLQGRWTAPVLFTLVYILAAMVVAAVLAWIPAVGGIIASFLLLPMIWAYNAVCLRNQRERNAFAISDLAEGYRTDFKRLFCTMGLQYVYIYLWTLLLVVPGIIKSYSYAMTPFILEDDKEIANNAAIEKSMAMMDGHKMELFLLDLSFIGWIILCVLTCGIGLLWLTPYQTGARAAFYESLKAEQEKEIAE